MTSSISGLGSGLDINSIIDQLMALERQPQKRVIAQRDAVQARLDALGNVRSRFSALNTAASALDRSASWRAFTSSTSDDTIATTTAGANATTGSLTFTVDQLATNAAIRSTNTIASTGTVITSGNLLLAKGAAQFGLATLAADGGLPLGKVDVRVTQASAAASRTADTALANSTTITAGVNDTITADVNGSPQTFTIAAGTYTRAQLATAVTTASGGLLTASVGATTNRLTVKTVAEGSSASIQLTGGTALTDLGLTVDASAALGVDGVVKVGDVSTTVSNVTAGTTVSLAAATGTVTATLAGGLRVGGVTAKNVSVGTGTLSSVVNAINQANMGINAAAVKVGENAYRLQITSGASGSAGRLNLDTGGFAGIGGLTTINVGSDAVLTIGSGDGAYSVSSSSNSVTTVLPGVTINLKKQSVDPVTISVGRDPNALADKVAAMVKAANDTISQIKSLSSYDVASKTGGPLSGVSAMRSLTANVARAVSSAVSGNSLGSGSPVGVSLDRSGNITFDRQKFLDKYNEDPDTVSDMFVRRGTTSNAAVTFKDATTRAKAGTYAVNVTTAPTRANATGNVLGSGIVTATETIDIKLGTTTATYAAAAGESLTSIANGINAAFAANSLALTASVSGNQLTIEATNYGTTGSFSVRSSAVGGGQTGLAASADTWEPHAGTNVAGTIGGKAATGNGAVLAVANSDVDIPGLAVTIDSTSTGSFGTITYAPGIAARVVAAALGATDVKSGALTAAEEGSRQSITRYNKDIDDWDRRLADRQARLKAQYAALDTTLGQLRSQGSWTSAALANLG